MSQDGYVEAYGLDHDREGIKGACYSSPSFYLRDHVDLRQRTRRHYYQQAQFYKGTLVLETEALGKSFFLQRYCPVLKSTKLVLISYIYYAYILARN